MLLLDQVCFVCFCALSVSQDMHKIANTCALKGSHKRYVTSELNPGDSHGVFGEVFLLVLPLLKLFSTGKTSAQEQKRNLL